MIAGGCRCGAVRYTLALDALPAVYCRHRRDCRTQFSEAAPAARFLAIMFG